MALFGFGKKKEEASVSPKPVEEVKIENPAQKAFEEKQKELEAVKEQAKEMSNQFSDHKGIIIVDYSALSIDEDTNLRKFCRENEIKLRSFVNEVASEAVKMTSFAEAASSFTGRVLTIFIDGKEQLDSVVNYVKENSLELDVKFSMLDGEKNVAKW